MFTLHWIYVFTVFGGEAENIVYTLYLDCIWSVFGALYLLCIWSEARYIVYTLYLELLGLYIQSRRASEAPTDRGAASGYLLLFVLNCIKLY